MRDAHNSPRNPRSLWSRPAWSEYAQGFMPISAPRRRARQFLIVALLLSIAIHVIGGGLWGLFSRVLARIVPKPLFMASLQEPPVPKTDIIRLERRVPAAARPAHENRTPKVAPRPHPIATIAPAPPRPRHEIAHITAHAPAQAAPDRGIAPSVAPPRHPKPIALAPVPDNKPALSDGQIQQMGSDFSKAIADSRETLAAVQAQSASAPVATIKHYTFHVNGIHEGMNPGDGEIIAISHQRIGNTMWYYARYTYMYGDGTYEADEIPWPMHYPIGDDPFARHDKRIPIQPPPEGYKPNRPLKPILQRYFDAPPETN